MPKYTYCYFNCRGLGDPVRMLFHQAGVEYEEHLVNEEAWAKKKEHTPFGKLPVIGIDDGRYGETTAITRYFGEKFGIGGKTAEDKLFMDSMVDATKESVINLIKPSYPPMTPEQRKEYFVKQKSQFAKTFEFIDRQMGKAAGKFLVGDQPTWADYQIFSLWNILVHFMGESVFDGTPNLQKHYKAMAGHDKVKSYMAKTKDMPTYPF